MAEVNFNCPRCQQSIEAPEDMVGESIKCAACGQLMTIPKPPTETGSPQENTEAPKSRIERAKIKIKSLFKIRPLLWIIPALLLGVIVATVAVILLMNPLYRMPEYWELRGQVDEGVTIIDIRFREAKGVGDVARYRIEYSTPEDLQEYEKYNPHRKQILESRKYVKPETDTNAPKKRMPYDLSTVQAVDSRVDPYGPDGRRYLYLYADEYGVWEGWLRGRHIRMYRRGSLPPVKPPKEKKPTRNKFTL